MKKCPYCGQQYPDEESVCVIDQNPLESCDPEVPRFGSGEVDAESPSIDSNADLPDAYKSLGKFEPIDADRLLQKFLEAGVRFQIDRIPRRVLTMGRGSGAGYIARDQIEIFVHTDDDQRAREIMTADWKV